MSAFLFQAAYTPESWKHQLQNQENPNDRLRPIIEGLGGHIVSFFYAFGEDDIILLCEMPSKEAAAAFSLAAAAGGSVKSLKTTALMTVEEGLAAMRQAAEAGKQYRAPISPDIMKETVRT